MAGEAEKDKTHEGRYLGPKDFALLWLFVLLNLTVFFSIFVNKQLAGPLIERYWQRMSARDGIVVALPTLASLDSQWPAWSPWKGTLGVLALEVSAAGVPSVHSAHGY